MKHKAKKWIFDLCWEIDFEGYEELLEPFEDLIDCQLTVEEMKFIANCLYVAGFVDENMVKQILGKFQKQKEMWVSDDD